MDASMEDSNVPANTMGVNGQSQGISFISGTTIENTPPKNALPSLPPTVPGPSMEEQEIARSALSLLPPSSIPTQESQKDDVELPILSLAVRITEGRSEIPDSEAASEISSPAKSAVGSGNGDLKTVTDTDGVNAEIDGSIEVPALPINNFKDESIVPQTERNDVRGPPASSALTNGEILDSDGESMDFTSDVTLQSNVEPVQATVPAREIGNEVSEKDASKIENGKTDDMDQIVLLPTIKDNGKATDDVEYYNLTGSPKKLLEEDDDPKEDIPQENELREPLTDARNTKYEPPKDREEHSRQGVQLQNRSYKSQDILIPSASPTKLVTTMTNEVDANELPSTTSDFKSSFVDEMVVTLSAQIDSTTAEHSTGETKDEIEIENSNMATSMPGDVDIIMEDAEAQLVTSTNSVQTEIAEAADTTESVEISNPTEISTEAVEDESHASKNPQSTNISARISSKRRLSETDLEAYESKSTAKDSTVIIGIPHSNKQDLDMKPVEPDTTMSDIPEEVSEIPSSSASSIQDPTTVADIPPSEVPEPKSEALPPPAKATEPLSLPVKPKSLQYSPLKAPAAEVSPSKDVLMAELKAIKIASIQARNATLQAEISAKKARLEEITKNLTVPAAETVKTHIKLLHDYNDIKDIGQGLVGMIAENRGVRIGELYEEFGVGLKD